jgi:hypothetical protein
LETITGPFKGVSTELPDYEISQVLRSVFGARKSLSELSEPKHLFLMTAGPNSSVSWKGTWLDIKAWSEHKELLPYLFDYIKHIGKTTPFAVTLERAIRYAGETSAVLDELVLGKLATKEEAAGKVRVFAIADSITQALLAPLHRYIFGLLKQLPMDGTFNQVAPLNRLIDLRKEGVLGSHLFWSYDLSAATDRLPIDLQAQVLNLLFGSTSFGQAWRDLLVKRPWSGHFYQVGQPMGALSSWAMLALTHHVIVKIAAQRVGISDFTHYALLGDDIVIAHDAVASSYHHIMTHILGVDINLTKSLISSTHFEYAKRLVSVDCELTPIGPKNILLYLKSPYGLISVLRDFIAKGGCFDEHQWDLMSETLPIYGKVLARKLDWVIKGPFGLVPTEAGLSSKIRLNNTLTPVDVDIISTSIDQVIFDEDYRQWEASLRSFNSVIKEIEIVSDVPTYLTYGNLGEKVSRPHHVELFKRIPDWQKVQFPDSLLYWIMRETVLSYHDRVLEQKPVRRFIYNGPLVHFNHYRADWLPTVMSYLSSKIYSWETIVPALDPFKDLTASPLRDVPTRGIKFFKKVHQEVEERRKYVRRF